MSYAAVCIVILPFVAYSLYQDWRDAATSRHRHPKKH
jgi:hypothetical protein